MSGHGTGDSVVGSLIGGLIGGAIYLAFGAVYLLGKGIIEGGKLIYNAHKKAVEKRREEERRALEKLEGELGRAALERHDRMVAAEKAAAETAEKARERLEAEALASSRRIDEAGDSIEAMLKEMPAFIASFERRAEESAKVEIEAFNASMDASMKAASAEVAAAVDSDAAAMGVKMDRLEAEIEGRVETYRNYARKALRESEELLDALKKSYDCEAVASGSYNALKEHIASLRDALDKGDAVGAASFAGIVARETQMLQVELEHKTSMLEQAKASLAAAAAELDAYVKASRELAGDGAPEAVAMFVDEECDAAFWSEGRLPKLWKDVEALKARIAAFGVNDLEAASGLLIEARMKGAALQRETFRTRNHVLSRVSMIGMIDDIVDSMAEIGWETVAWDDEGTVVIYAKLNPATDHYEPSDDPRADLVLRFRNDMGDVRTVVLHNEFDPDAGTYVQTMYRFCHEEGMPDEMERADVDEQFREALERINPKVAALAPTCDADTRGQKLRG